MAISIKRAAKKVKEFAHNHPIVMFGAGFIACDALTIGVNRLYAKAMMDHFDSYQAGWNDCTESAKASLGDYLVGTGKTIEEAKEITSNLEIYKLKEITA